MTSFTAPTSGFDINTVVDFSDMVADTGAFGFVRSVGGDGASISISNVCDGNSFGTASISTPADSGSVYGRAGLYLSKPADTSVDRSWSTLGVDSCALEARVKSTITQPLVTLLVGIGLSHNPATLFNGLPTVAQECIGFYVRGFDPIGNWRATVWMLGAPVFDVDSGVSSASFADLRVEFEWTNRDLTEFLARFIINGSVKATYVGTYGNGIVNTAIPHVEIRDKTGTAPNTGSGRISTAVVDYMLFEQRSRRYL